MTINKTGKYKTTQIYKGGNGGSVWTIPKNTEFTVTQIDRRCHKFYSSVFGGWKYWEVDAQRIGEPPVKDNLPNPVRYYEDGQPYVLIEGVEITNYD